MSCLFYFHWPWQHCGNGDRYRDGYSYQEHLFIENLQLGYSAIRFQEEIPLAAAAVLIVKLFTVSIGNLCNDLILHLITVVRT